MCYKDQFINLRCMSLFNKITYTCDRGVWGNVVVKDPESIPSGDAWNLSCGS